jgi:hypothetical protein
MCCSATRACRSSLTVCRRSKLDRDKIKQVILNLCKTAVEAMPEWGCLTLKSYLSSADTLVLAITDTGIGIPEGMGVFENLPNHQARRQGFRPASGQPNSFSSPRQVDYSSEPGKQHSAYHYL